MDYQQSVKMICDTLVAFSTKPGAIIVISKFFTVIGNRYYFLSKAIGKSVCIDTEDRKIYLLESIQQGDLDNFPEITWSDLLVFWAEVATLLEKNTIEVLKSLLFQLTSDFISYGISSFLEGSSYIENSILFWQVGYRYARIDPATQTAVLVSNLSDDPGKGEPLNFEVMENIVVTLEKLLAESRVVSEEFILKAITSPGQRAWYFRFFSLN